MAVDDIPDFDFRSEVRKPKPEERPDGWVEGLPLEEQSWEIQSPYGYRIFDGPHRAPDEKVYGTTWIYFVQAEHGGPIKIGQSNDPIQRLKQLQTSSPYPLVLRRVVNGAPEMEHRLHALFKDHRLNGEWFMAVRPLAEMCDGIADDDAPEAVTNHRTSWRPLEGEVTRVGRVTSISKADSARKQREAQHPDAGYVKPRPNETVLTRWEKRQLREVPDDKPQPHDKAA